MYAFGQRGEECGNFGMSVEKKKQFQPLIERITNDKENEPYVSFDAAY